MGTRALTIVQEDNGQDICVLYRQMDGYPSNHGQELAELLKGRTIVNGIRHGHNNREQSNGMGCLAATIVVHFKTDIGGFYLHPSGSRDCGESYRYIVYPAGERIKLRVESGYNGRVIFEDFADNFTPEACNEEGE